MKLALRNIGFRPWLLVSAAWLGPALLAAFQDYLRARLGNESVAWAHILWEGVDWILCAAFTPLIFVVAERYPLGRGRLWTSLPLHVVAALAFCAAWALTGAFFRSILIPKTGGDWFPSPLLWFLTTLPFGFAVYFGVVAAEHAFRFLIESRQTETKAALLAAQLAQARLGALRMQLNPHFLFNSLNTILVLVRDGESRTAADSIERLATVLRRILRVDQEHEVPLSDEIEFLEQYLAIEQARFSDRLRPTFEIPHSLRRAAVPALILQPAIENALRHGIGQSTESGRLAISARREGNDLILMVEDDGVGLPPSGLIEGVGLANTRERLATLYGERASLQLLPGAPKGTVAVFRLPFREIGPTPGESE